MAETENGILFKLEDVFYHSGDSEVLKNINLTFHSRRVILLTGPSGSGKSTLLRLLGMLISPTSGQIIYQGKPLDDYDPGGYRARALLVGQKPYLIDATVRDNLLLPFGLKNNKEKKIQEDKFGELLQRVGLDRKFLEKQSKKISGGEAQRVALVRALALEPETLLLDEPTSALDMASEEQVVGLLSEEKSRRSIVVVAHSPTFLDLADNAVILKQGKIAHCKQILSAQELKSCLEGRI